MIAFFPSLGFQEMFVLLVIGLLLYGRNLPEAGRTLGRVAAQLRRGFQEFKDQMDQDANVSEMKRTLQDTKDEMRRAAAIPRAVADPRRALRDLTNEAMSSPLPDESEILADGPLAKGTLAEGPEGDNRSAAETPSQKSD